MQHAGNVGRVLHRTGAVLALLLTLAPAGGYWLAAQQAPAQPPAPVPAAAVPIRPPTPPVVLKASAYLGGYLRALSNVVSEEQYDQRVEQPGVGSNLVGRTTRYSEVQQRRMASDVLLVQLPGVRGWYEFRDVFWVDGTTVRDRNDRLMKLFVESHADRLAQADLIQKESSRYNLGSGSRDTNLPTFVLQFLLPTVVSRFAFSPGEIEAVEGVDAQVVSYVEIARPTIIQGGVGVDMPASGRLWIDPATGAILKTRLETKSESVQTRVDVTYRMEPKLGLRVPALMEERREAVGEVLTGLATYGNFRRFTVETDEKIKKD